MSRAPHQNEPCGPEQGAEALGDDQGAHEAREAELRAEVERLTGWVTFWCDKVRAVESLADKADSEAHLSGDTFGGVVSTDVLRAALAASPAVDATLEPTSAALNCPVCGSGEEGDCICARAEADAKSVWERSGRGVREGPWDLVGILLKRRLIAEAAELIGLNEAVTPAAEPQAEGGACECARRGFHLPIRFHGGEGGPRHRCWDCGVGCCCDQIAARLVACPLHARPAPVADPSGDPNGDNQ